MKALNYLKTSQYNPLIETHRKLSELGKTISTQGFNNIELDTIEKLVHNLQIEIKLLSIN